MVDMSHEALSLIQDTATKADVPRVVPIPGDKYTVLIAHNGTLEKYALPPDRRSHSVRSVDDLAKAAGVWGAGGTVWHNHAGVSLVVDDDQRRDVVTLPLVESAVFKRLRALETNSKFDQRGMISLLRVDLNGAFEDGGFVANLRALKFRRSTSGSAELQQGKESLGREIEAEVSGTADFPEELLLTIPVYSNPVECDESFEVRCAFDIDVQNEQFSFRAFPDELDYAIQAAQNSIRTRLVTLLPTQVPVFNGKP